MSGQISASPAELIELTVILPVSSTGIWPAVDLYHHAVNRGFTRLK